MSRHTASLDETESLSSKDRKVVFARLGSVLSPIIGTPMLWHETLRYWIEEKGAPSSLEILIGMVCVGVSAVGFLLIFGWVLGWITGILGNRSIFGALLGFAFALTVYFFSVTWSSNPLVSLRSLFAGTAFVGAIGGGVVILHRCLNVGWLRLWIEDYFVVTSLVACYLLAHWCS